MRGYVKPTWLLEKRNGSLEDLTRLLNESIYDISWTFVQNNIASWVDADKSSDRAAAGAS
jgi:hypothetical protein